jgi:hypothetical protein
MSRGFDYYYLQCGRDHDMEGNIITKVIRPSKVSIGKYDNRLSLVNNK